jgi:hypothetical protein
MMTTVGQEDRFGRDLGFLGSQVFQSPELCLVTQAIAARSDCMSENSTFAGGGSPVRPTVGWGGAIQSKPILGTIRFDHGTVFMRRCKPNSFFAGGG